MARKVLTPQVAARLIKAAVRAPSPHNTQPWLFVVRLADQAIDLHADRSRTLRHSDPAGRYVHIACGAALFNLRMAALQLGVEPVVRLLPCRADYLLLASVRLAGPHQLRPAERELYQAMTARRGGPGRAAARRPAPCLPRAELTEAAALEGGTLRFIEPGQELQMTGPVRPLVAADSGRPPQLAVLSTPSDDRAAWLRSGQALQRVLLLAAQHGFTVAPAGPALEVPAVPGPRGGRWMGEQAQLILRFSPGRRMLPGARRPLAEVMQIADPARPGRSRPAALPGSAPDPAARARRRLPAAGRASPQPGQPVVSLAAARSACGQRTMSTGRSARWITLCAVLPSSSPARSPRPREPMMMTSTSSLRASSTISLAA